VGSIPTFGISDVRRPFAVDAWRPPVKRAFAAGSAVLALALAAAGCRGADPSACSDVHYGGQGEPDSVVVSDLPLQGPSGAMSAQINSAIRQELAVRRYRVGARRVGFVACDDSSGKTGLTTAGACSANANEVAGDERVIGLIGPLDSRCAAIMLPVLNRAPDGAIPMISPSNTYPCLTRAGAGCDATEPDKYYPSGERNYLRVAPSDVFQSAAAAEFMRDRGVEKVYVLHDDEAYGVGVASGFRAAARSLGLEVVGFEGWDPEEESYAGLFHAIDASGADAVFLGGLIAENGGQVLRDKVAVLGPNDGDVMLVASDGFAEKRTITDAGGAASGMYVVNPGVPLRELGARAKRYATALAASDGSGSRPTAGSVYGAQAAKIMLDAIARSDGSRSGVTRRLFRTRVSDGLLGTFGFDAGGDPARAEGPVVAFSVLRASAAAGRGFEVETTVDPEPATVEAAGR
jgi:branched-chain amino acid transport system substrate-binding protein